MAHVSNIGFAALPHERAPALDPAHVQFYSSAEQSERYVSHAQHMLHTLHTWTQPRVFTVYVALRVDYLHFLSWGAIVLFKMLGKGKSSAISCSRNEPNDKQ
jgi:hypothetical protein